MKTLYLGRRVQVVRDADGVEISKPGLVTRVRRDGGAWVALDERFSNDRVHPFPAGDPRGCHVLAYPEDCEPTAEPLVPVGMFGRDHWSTLLYVETCCVDNEGRVARERIRTHTGRHPEYAHVVDGAEYPTRLQGGARRADHDDWDCVTDLQAAGFLECVQPGPSVHGRPRLPADHDDWPALRGKGRAPLPTFRMTPLGRTVVSALRILCEQGVALSRVQWRDGCVVAPARETATSAGP